MTTHREYSKKRRALAGEQLLPRYRDLVAAHLPARLDG